MNRRVFSCSPKVVIGFLAILSLTLVTSASSGAAELEVTNLNDHGAGSLRDTVARAAPGDTIRFADGLTGAIVLTTGEITLSKDLRILGPGAKDLSISGNNRSRVFRVDDGDPSTMSDVELSGLSVTEGRVHGENGGAVLNLESLKIVKCAISKSLAVGDGDRTGNGGGIFNLGKIVLTGSTIYGNTARSAAADTDTGNGGGIYNAVSGDSVYAGAITMTNCTVSGNTAKAPRIPGETPERISAGKRGFGGGLFNDAKTDRELDLSKGENALKYVGATTLEFCTFGNNTAHFGGGICNYVFMPNPDHEEGKIAGPLELKSSIISENLSTHPPSENGGNMSDLVGEAMASNSLVNHVSGKVGGENNLIGQSGLLSPLADDGGGMPAHALMPESPAINAGLKDDEVKADQYGNPRVSGRYPDMGAVEYQLKVFLARGGEAVPLIDADGDLVRVVLQGPGVCEVYTGEGADVKNIYLHDTTTMSSLAIRTGGGRTTVRKIDVQGSLQSITATGVDLVGSIKVTGRLGTMEMGNATGPGSIVVGKTPKLGVAVRLAQVSHMDLNVGGTLQSLRAVSFVSPGFSAIGAEQIGTIEIANWLKNIKIYTPGSIGKISVGGMDNCEVHAGTQRTLVGFPVSTSDFENKSDIASVRITGKVADGDECSFVNSDIGGGRLGLINLGRVKTGNGGGGFGLASLTSIYSLSFQVQLLGGTWSVKGLKNVSAPYSKHEQDFYMLNIGSPTPGLSPDGKSITAPDAPWSFAVMDDSRGGVGMPVGVAYWNLGPLFDDAYRNNSKFIVLPGDIVGGLLFPIAQYTTFFLPWNTHYRDPGKTVFPVRGNHECYYNLIPMINRAFWSSFFGYGLPQNGPFSNSEGQDERGFTYTVEAYNTFLVMLDEYMGTTEFDGGVVPLPGSPVPSIYSMEGSHWYDASGAPTSGNWLQTQFNKYLSDSSLQHCYVFGHVPLYKSCTVTNFVNNGHEAERNALLKAMNRVAEVYFCGHDHYYDHKLIAGTSMPDGYKGIDALHQVLVGTAGADLDWDVDMPADAHYICDPAKQCMHGTHRMGYNLVTVSGRDVSISFRTFKISRGTYWWLYDEITGYDKAVNQWSYSTAR